MTFSPAVFYPQQGELQPPVPEPPVADWWTFFQQHRDTDMPPQVQSWTCSICSTDWVLRATGLNPDSTREQVAGQIGYPSCVNESVGLANTQCLIPVFARYGVDSVQEWVGWDRLLEIAAETTGVLNGLGWYHFVGIRGVGSGVVDIANSARGYDGVYDTLSQAQFNTLGPFQVVRLVH